MPAESQYSHGAPGAGLENALSFTPTWRSTGTQPVLGNGTLSGRYAVLGEIVFVRIRLLIGSTTTFGTGTYTWDVPSDVRLEYPVVGSAGIFDSSPGAVHSGICRYDSTTTIAVVETDSNNFWGPTAPMTWANGDDMQINYWAFVDIA